MKSATLFDKLWDRHVVAELGDGYALIFVDRHNLNDLAGRGFITLDERGLRLAHPELTFATPDHTVATLANAGPEREMDNQFVLNLRRASETHGFRLFDYGHPAHGIIHLVAAEQGLALPGLTIACGDSHTCTLGAFGALAWGVGQSELVHVLATQTSVQRRPKTMRLRIEGERSSFITAKDIALHLIGQLGVAAGASYAVEFAGAIVRNMSMEERFTLCNMAVEFGARFGLIAPDEKTFDYLAGLPFAPRGDNWRRAVEDWRSLVTDPDATFDEENHIDITHLEPQVTWGINPGQAGPIGGAIPDNPDARNALNYMGLESGQSIRGLPIDMVFIGSCTNSRISDLRAAAEIVRGRKVAAGILAWVSPGSRAVADQAEFEGLKAVFIEAGFNWGAPGCSMCAGAGDRQREIASPRTRLVSTTNRNFIGRQGPGARTHLASPVTAAAAAIAGRIVDVRDLEPLDGEV